VRADWIPERYPPSGTIGAAGFIKLLGRPQLDPLTVLVRETAQNSWDARSPRGKVKYAIHGRDLEESERSALVKSVLTKRDRAVGTGLDQLPRACAALFIVDRGTIGLGGPVSASEVSEDDTYDWVDFVLNVGKANTAGHTGGTYGFGKTIAYVVSSVNTVVVYSRANHQGALESRLMACAIGTEFDSDGALYTGRHWWGVKAKGAPTPILGDDADALAAELGMPPFEGKDTGTTLMIVDPDFGGRTPEQGMRFLVEAALWNLWPKLINQPSGIAEMSAAFSWNGKKIPLPSPESRPPLGAFVQAFQGLIADRVDEEVAPGLRRDSIGIERPRLEVGELAIVPMVLRARASVDDGSLSDDPDSPRPAALIIGPSHHVALLRSPNLVVEYLEGPPAPEANFEWAGVFKAAEAQDHVFAMAEPPTHDTWRPDLISDRTLKSIVKVGLQNVRRVLDERWGSRPAAAASPSSSTSAVAHQLAHLVAGSLGTGASVVDTPGGTAGGGSSRRAARIQIISSGPVEHDSELQTQISFLVIPSSGSSSTELLASIGIALAGGGVDQSSDLGLRFVSARIDGVETLLDGRSIALQIEATEPAKVELVACRTTDLSIAFDLQVAAGEVGA
jgi:hypothetical protein